MAANTKNMKTHLKQELSLKYKLTLFSFPFFFLLFAFIIDRLSSDLFISIFGCDSQGAYGEWIQFICFSIAGGVGVATWRLMRKEGIKKESVLLALFFIGCFFIALEEISYGQWIFHWKAPAFFLEVNAQKETNIHNIPNLGFNIHKVFMAIGFFGSFAWIYKHISIKKKGGGYLLI
jgi:hypothetical protein